MAPSPHLVERRTFKSPNENARRPGLTKITVPRSKPSIQRVHKNTVLYTSGLSYKIRSDVKYTNFKWKKQRAVCVDTRLFILLVVCRNDDEILLVVCRNDDERA